MSNLYTESAEQRRDYLRNLYIEENDRQSIVEGKQSQLLGQSSVILSLVGLFIPMYMDKLSSVTSYLQVALIVIFLLTLFFYFRTIFFSSRHLNAAAANYQRLSAGTVNDHFDSKAAFHEEEIRDMLTCIDCNKQINDTKVVNLQKAYRNFTIANVCTAILAVSLLGSIFLLPKPGIPEVKVKGPVQVEEIKPQVHQP